MRFQRRLLIQVILGELREFGCIPIARMLDDALAHFKRQVEPAERRITLLKIFHNAQGMQIVIEEQTMAAHHLV